MPFPAERSLVSIGSVWTGYFHSAVSLPEYLDYRGRARSFASIAVFSNASVNLPADAGRLYSCTFTNTYHPSVVITKTGDALSKIGDKVHYTRVATNTSPSGSARASVWIASDDS